MYLQVIYANNMFQKKKKILESHAVDPQHKRIMDLPRGSSKTATKLITGLEHLSSEREDESCSCSDWRKEASKETSEQSPSN